MQSESNFNPLVRGNKSCIYVGNKGHMFIGDHVGVSSACLWCIDKITIGNNVKIGANSVIMDNDAHSLDFIQRRLGGNDSVKSKPITVEDDVLKGASCYVLKGVMIGARSIIGPGSVVTKDIPSDCVDAGNPCRVIKKNN